MFDGPFEWDCSNKPAIEDIFHPILELTPEVIPNLLVDDYGDSLLVFHPDTAEQWLFQYAIEGNKKVLEPNGVIQL